MQHVPETVTCSHACVCVRVLVAQSCLTLFECMDCSPPGSCVLEIFQAKIVEWVAISSSGDLPYPGIKLTSPMSPALADEFFMIELLGKPSVQFSGSVVSDSL